MDVYYTVHENLYRTVAICAPRPACKQRSAECRPKLTRAACNPGTGGGFWVFGFDRHTRSLDHDNFGHTTGFPGGPNTPQWALPGTGANCKEPDAPRRSSQPGPQPCAIQQGLGLLVRPAVHGRSALAHALHRGSLPPSLPHPAAAYFLLSRFGVLPLSFSHSACTDVLPILGDGVHHIVLIGAPLWAGVIHIYFYF